MMCDRAAVTKKTSGSTTSKTDNTTFEREDDPFDETLVARVRRRVGEMFAGDDLVAAAVLGMRA
jgi:hypothetical protein